MDSIPSLLGLALRAGRLAVGDEPVGAACRGHKAYLLLLASDAADNTIRRASHFSQSAKNTICLQLPLTKAELGSGLGRTACAMAALTDVGFAAAVAQRLPFLSPAADLWSWTRYVLLFCIFFLFLMGVLNLAAPFGTPRLPMLVSSLVSALALVVSSAVFSWFIGLSTRLSLVYGSLVSLIILLLWLYLCGQILFLGIVFTSVWYRRRKK